ncbi:hypothetical protein DNTS_015175, partial [Danionella cerebrum]
VLLVMAASAELPPFRLGESRFYQGSFYGRLRHFLDVIDPRTLCVSENRLKECMKLLDQFKTGTLPPGVTSTQLWEAQKIKQNSAVMRGELRKSSGWRFSHTSTLTFPPHRSAVCGFIMSSGDHPSRHRREDPHALSHVRQFSSCYQLWGPEIGGFVPFGTPVVVGLLLPNQTLASTIFWQWLNQSHNACVNYCNRNATKPTPKSTFFQGYLGAVSSAVSIAVGLNVLIKRAERFSPATRVLVQRFIPFPAVASANVCNVLLMRHTELSEGISVLDDDGNVVGTSKIAARHALMETALTRVVLPMPILLLPPLVMALYERLPVLQKHPRLALPLQCVVCLSAFGLALPIAISLFPQNSQIHASELEPEISAATNCQILTYNKGL